MFALLPGSRLSEIEMHAELVLETARACYRRARATRSFLVPFVTRATRDAFENAMHRTGHEQLPITLLYGHAEDALRAADVGIVASGTATLEAALARCPHVIFYRVIAIDRLISSCASSCCPTSDCPMCSPGDSWCPNSCRATPRRATLRRRR